MAQSSMSDAEQRAAEEKQMTVTRNKGRDGGLFRAMMDEIRGGHSVGQALRGAMFVAGLLTDRGCYAEVLAQFYLATRALEKRVEAASGKGMAAQLETLGLRFAADYEADLALLLGPGEQWHERCAAMASAPAREYERRIAEGDDMTMAAAAFILWGPLAIGGGPGLKARISKAFGEEYTNVFRQVTGPGRSKMRDQFIGTFDDLIGDAGPADERRQKLVKETGEFMNLNNELMRSVKVRPWWMKHVYVAGGATFVVCMAFAWKRYSTS